MAGSNKSNSVEIDKLQNKVEELEKEIAWYQDKENNLLKELESLKSNCKVLTETLKKHKDDGEKLSKENFDFENENQLLKYKLEEETKKLEALRNQQMEY